MGKSLPRHRPHTSHAIVGEALTELVHHNEGNAQGVVGATEFLWETNKNISIVKAFTPTTYSPRVWTAKRSPVQKPSAHSCLTGLWAGLRRESGPHTTPALIKAPQWISLDMGPVRAVMGICELPAAHHACSSRNSTARVLPTLNCNAKKSLRPKITFGCLFFCTSDKAATLPQNFSKTLSSSTRPCLRNWETLGICYLLLCVKLLPLSISASFLCWAVPPLTEAEHQPSVQHSLRHGIHFIFQDCWHSYG